MALLVRRADIALFGRGGGPVDIRVEGEHVAEIGPVVSHRGVDAVIDAAGGTVVPGLHDHHVHLRALAAARTSVEAGPPHVRDAVELSRRLLAAAASISRPGGWVRAVGYHQSVAGDLDRAAVDHLCPTIPVRIQHASGVLWILNSAAIDVLGIDALAAKGATPPGIERDDDGRSTGRVWREDAWLAERVGYEDVDLAAVSRQAAARGVTGFTDATPGRLDLDGDVLVAAAAAGTIVQRLHLMADAGAPPTSERHVTLGPVKVLLDDATLPPLDGLAAVVAGAHRSRRPVAVHCVTRVQGVLAVAAIEQAGARAGDRIEHGAVLAPDILPQLRRLGLTVVTQPGMAAARGDRYLAEVDPDEVDDLWRAASIEEAGVQLAGSTDAPYGPADPWVSVRDAVARRTPAGVVLGEGERLGWSRAVRLFTGWAEDPARTRTIGPGQPADLCVLAAPLASGDPAPPPDVLATVVAGRVVYGPAGQ